MSGKILISVVLGVIVIGGGLWLLSSGSNESTSATSEATPADSVDTNDTSAGTEANLEGTASMRELIARGEALRCSFSFANPDGTAGNGTGYFASDERMRMESAVTQDGETYEVDYVITDDTMYMWGESEQGTFGMQMDFSDVESANPATDASEVPVEMDDDVTYSCNSWAVDESVFVLPTDVEFIDMSAMMQGMPGASGMTPEQMEALQQQYMP